MECWESIRKKLVNHEPVIYISISKFNKIIFSDNREFYEKITMAFDAMIKVCVNIHHTMCESNWCNQNVYGNLVYNYVKMIIIIYYWKLTVSKFNRESTAFALAALSFSFISRLNFVRHSVIRTVATVKKRHLLRNPLTKITFLEPLAQHWLGSQEHWHSNVSRYNDIGTAMFGHSKVCFKTLHRQARL